VLTTLAAFGLVVIMLGATVTTAMGEPKTLVALPFVVLCLVGYVAWTQQSVAGGTAGGHATRPA